MCIRESLRLHSPVQAVTRTYTQDMALPGDCVVPQGETSLDGTAALLLMVATADSGVTPSGYI